MICCLQSVGLPVKRTDIAKLSAFEVEHAGVLLHGIVFVIDHSNVITVLQRTVVVNAANLVRFGRVEA